MRERDTCRKGHPYSPENTRVETIRQLGREYKVRRCKRCQSIRVGAYQKGLRHEFPLRDRGLRPAHPKPMTQDETTVLMLALAADGQSLRYRAVQEALGGEPWCILRSLANQGSLLHAGYNDWRITEKGRIAAALAMAKDPALAAAMEPEKTGS